MLMFVLLASLLLLSATGFILFSLLKKTAVEDYSRTQNKMLYQQRLAELDADKDNDLINEDQIDNIKKELRLAFTAGNDAAPDPTPVKRPVITIILLCCCIPAFVITMYHYLGEADYIVRESLLRELHQAETDTGKQVAMMRIVAWLEQDILTRGDDIESRLMLVNFYVATEKYPDALQIIDSLHRQHRDNPGILFRYADILRIANNGAFQERSIALIERGLAIEPDNPKGLWLAGLAANRRGDIKAATTYWEKLSDQLEPDSAARKQIEKFLETIRESSDDRIDESERGQNERSAKTPKD